VAWNNSLLPHFSPDLRNPFKVTPFAIEGRLTGAERRVRTGYWSYFRCGHRNVACTPVSL